MALNIAAAHAHGLDLANAFAPQITPAPKLLARADDAPQVNLFVDGDSEDYEYAASVVSACSDATIWAIRCTDGSAGSATCGPNAEVVTVTESAGGYRVSSSTSTKIDGTGVKLEVIETCQIADDAATCTATISGSADGQSTKTSDTVTYTGADFSAKQYDVAVTGGAEKTASASGTCNAASGLNTRAVALWGMLGAVGVVGVLAL
ncbi:hypothetical protein GGR57DRAFT_364222 [Xylariaceae sp. FL1272]|nr:hypothetical protein GGR57DRAFT_364222 [Xylariaceae sp. FL1272]